jgi:crotonobetainyl-CoA:carnitine CoA-transferase CaiB-like acyl-CoA transferase
MSGMAAVTGALDGPPMRSGVTIVDFGAGVMLAYGVMTALWRRARTGRGSAVTTSLLDTAMTFSSALYPLSDALGGAPPPRQENRSHAILADQFAARDGFVVLAVWDERRWQALCSLLGLDALAADPELQSNMARLGRYERVRPALQAAIAGWEVASLVSQLVALKIPCTPTYDASVVKDDPHVQAIEALYVEQRLGVPFQMVAGAVRADGRRQMGETAPPRLGEHTDEVLAERLGLSAAELDALRAAGAIGRAGVDGPAT